MGSGIASGGSYSITTSTLTAGTHSITTKTSDAAGNTSVASAALSVTIDSAAPTAPSTPDLVAAADSGLSSTDNITSMVTPTFAGTAEAGSTVTIFSDGVAVGTGIAAGGTYTITTSAVSDGAHSITAKATDIAGNVSAASASVLATVDSTAPAAPSSPDLVAASDTGSSSTDNITSVTTPVFIGTAESGSTVSIFSDGVPVGSGVATGGTYSIATSALADGSHFITGTATDAAGNVSIASAELPLIIDTAAPATPTTPDLTAATDSGLSNIDNTTSITTPTFAGTAETGTTVTILSDGVAVGSGSATAGSYSITTSTLSAGARNITAKATDSAGNVSATSVGLSLAIDTKAPAAPLAPDLDPSSDTGLSNIDNITDVATPTFNGTAEIGSTVTIFSDAVAVGSGIATSGSYSITTTVLSAAVHNITAKATDLAGNVSPASAGLAVTVLPQSALVPSRPDLTTASDSGTSNTDNATSITTPTFAGTAEAGSTVTVFSDGVSVGSGVATGGNYSVATSQLSDGIHKMTASNTSGTSPVLLVTIDTVPPASPLAPDLAAASNSGPLSSDNVTSVTTPTFTGTVEAGSAVTVFSDGVVVGSGSATGGSYSITTSLLSNGTHNIATTATDVAGNDSTASAGLSVTIDTTTPSAPSMPDLTVADDSGLSSTDNVTSLATPTFTGTAEAGSTVTILSDGVAVGSGFATGGSYSITTTALSAGTHSITAKTTDAAGNASVASIGLSVTIDTTSPSAPATPDLTAATDSGSSNTDNITNVTGPTFTGTAEAGSPVAILSNGVAVGSGLATGGNYTITTSALTSGVHSVTAKATDLAGNVSSATPALSVTIDGVSPTLPSAPDLTTTSNSGPSKIDNITSVTAPTFGGTAETGSTVTILSDGVAVGSGVATSSIYSITTSTLSNGVHAITATATDAAGNVSTTSAGLSVTIDSTAPSAPSTPDLDTTSDEGSSNTDNLTDVVTPAFSGTAEADSTVTIFSDGTAVGSAVATGGSYSITTSVLADGAHSITAAATDAAGNVSAASAGLSVTIDTTSPSTPPAPDLTAATDSGSSNSDNTTKLTGPTFTGTADAGSTVTIFSDGAVVGSGLAVSGSYSIATTTLPDGTHSITATATNVAGNESVESAALSLTIDATSPILAITGISPDTGTSASDGVTAAGAVTISGTIDLADAGRTVTISRDGSSVGTAAVNQVTGAWILANVALAEGSHVLTAQATDVAGNLGTSVTVTAIRDATAPAAPSVPDLTTGSIPAYPARTTSPRSRRRCSPVPPRPAAR